VTCCVSLSQYSVFLFRFQNLCSHAEFNSYFFIVIYYYHFQQLLTSFFLAQTLFVNSSLVPLKYLPSVFDLNIVSPATVWEDIFLSSLLFSVSICTHDKYERKDSFLSFWNFVVFRRTILESS